MNYKTVSFYVLAAAFFLFLVVAYVKFSNKNLKYDVQQLTQDVVNQVRIQLNNEGIVSNKDIGSLDAKIEEKVRSVIQNDPDIVIKAIQQYQEKQEFIERQKASAIIKGLKDNLENNALDPAGGNTTNPKIKIIEFFDYNCGVCKRMSQIHEQAMAKNPDVMFIFKEVPMGEQSVLASQISLAVNFLDKTKYMTFQKLLFNYSGDKTQESLLSLAKQAGLDSEQVIKFLSNKDNFGKIEQVLHDNLKLATSIGMRGVPAYIIGDQVIYGGSPDYQSFQNMIDGFRTKLQDDKQKMQNSDSSVGKGQTVTTDKASVEPTDSAVVTTVPDNKSSDAETVISSTPTDSPKPDLKSQNSTSDNVNKQPLAPPPLAPTILADTKTEKSSVSTKVEGNAASNAGASNEGATKKDKVADAKAGTMAKGVSNKNEISPTTNPQIPKQLELKNVEDKKTAA